MPGRGWGCWTWTGLDWQQEGCTDGAALVEMPGQGCTNGDALMVDWGGCWANVPAWTRLDWRWEGCSDGAPLVGMNGRGCTNGAALMGLDWGGCWTGGAVACLRTVYSHSLEFSAYVSSSWNSASRFVPTPSFLDLGLYKHTRGIIDQISMH